MAALCTGISYGLSQSWVSNENKELIFVKLTDSAYRAIEEYQKNQVSVLVFYKFFLFITPRFRRIARANDVELNTKYKKLIENCIYARHVKHSISRIHYTFKSK